MYKWSDIFRSVDLSAMLNGYGYTNDIGIKKQIITDSLKLYLLNKLAEDGRATPISDTRMKNITIDELLDILEQSIPQSEHYETIRYVTHYITAVASNLQGWEIVWYVEDNPKLIENPLARVNGQGKWNSITTHKNTSYTNTAKFAYGVFNNQLLVKNDVKQLTYQKEL